MIRLRILAVFFGIVGFFNLIRASTVGYIAPALQSWELSVPLPFLGGLYGVWGGGFLVLAVLLWCQRARQWSFPVAFVYQVNVWILNLCAARSSYTRMIWRRDLVLTMSFLCFVVLLILPKIKKGYG
ncbi:MAG: hypothetical protein JXA33_17930 [Anaerolineae bacterium]|nr:hypothetical protein [Anaerolineae bacterium]